VNKFRFTVKQTDTEIDLPIEIKFDGLGREDLVRQYENDVLEEIINPIEDFEVTRYSHNEWLDDNQNEKTSTTYSFHFFNRQISVENTTAANNGMWVSDYNYIYPPVYSNYSGITFTDKELYYYANSFKRSFFKIDFYDSVKPENQQLYFTIIIPTQQGRKESVDIGTASVPNVVDLRTPTFDLDFVGDKEGYFIYWLKSREYINIDDFYMSAKFFNAKTGQFTRMMNRPQSMLTDKFNFNKEEYFYYKVSLDVNNYVYEVFKMFGAQNRVGTTIENINWYEYVNPQ